MQQAFVGFAAELVTRPTLLSVCFEISSRFPVNVIPLSTVTLPPPEDHWHILNTFSILWFRDGTEQEQNLAGQ